MRDNVFAGCSGGPADGFNGNMACNWPLRGMKRTLFEGGVRGVGLISGAGLTKKGITLDGKFHAADWMPTLLAAAAASVPDGLSWRDVASVGRGLDLDGRSRASTSEPPFELGDGQNLWPYLSGAVRKNAFFVRHFWLKNDH